jgi:hydroxypyruvate reductase
MSSISDLRNIALEIFHRTLAAIDVESVAQAYTRLNNDQLVVGEEEIDLARFKRVIVIAIGKASVPMARAVEAVLGDRINDGLVATNAVIGALPQHLPVIIGGHPLPNIGSIEAASRALEILRANDAADTLALFLISGGGSALFERPIDPGVTLDDLQTINRALVGCGAVIGEMNVVRRFLSAVKGGRLAASAPRSRQVSLYVSDVNSDDLSTVSSGPTLPGNVTRDEFDRTVARYDLLSKFPSHVAALIASGSLPDLPQAGEETSQRSHHLLLDNRQALLEARRIAESDFSCVVEIAHDLIEGEVKQMAREHIERIIALRKQHPDRTVCLLSGGEVICPVRGNGQGGRNQEFVLRAALEIEQQGEENLAVLSAGTDGIDGNSPSAGAIASAATISRARSLALSPEDYLRDSDSFSLFSAIGDSIVTGPTGNNVRDLRILLAQ